MLFKLIDGKKLKNFNLANYFAISSWNTTLNFY